MQGFNTVMDDAVMRVVRLRFTAGEKEFVLAVAQSRERQAALLRTGMVHEALAQTAVLLVAFYLLWYGLTYVARPMKALQQHLDARSADDWTPLPEQLAPHEIAPLIASTNALIEGCGRRSAPRSGSLPTPPISCAHRLPRCVPRANCCSACRRGRSVIMHCSAWWPPGAAPAVSRTSCWRLPAPKAWARRGSPAGAAECLVRVSRATSCRKAIEREIDFAFEPAPAELAVMGDATLLGELARNLVDNAFKYTPRGGSVVLAVLGEPSRIVVDDSGPGVAEADRERVFAPFSRVAQLDTEVRYPDTGDGSRTRHCSRGGTGTRCHRRNRNLVNERREICCQFRVSRASERRKPAL